MKPIKIKIKYILASLVIVFLVITVRSIAAPEILYTYANGLSVVGKNEKADAVYQKLVEQFPHSTLSINALYKRCASQFEGNGDVLTFANIYSYSSSFGSYKYGKLIRFDDLNKINEEYNKITDAAKAGEDYDRLQMVVALVNWFGGNSDYSFKLMKAASNSMNNSIKFEASLYLSIMELQSGDYAESRKILSSINSEDPELEGYKKIIMWNIEAMQGRNEKMPELLFKEDRKTLVNLFTILENIQHIGIGNSDKAIASSKIMGTVHYAGTPLNGVIIGLNRAIIDSDGGIGGDQDLEFITTTAADGSYCFDNIPEGNYFVDIAAPWFRIKDAQINYNGEMSNNRYIVVKNSSKTKIDINLNPPFEARLSPVSSDNTIDIFWEPYPGAAYYRVEVGPLLKGDKNSLDLFNASFADSTKATGYHLDFNKYADISMKWFGYSSISEDSNKLYLDPNYIIGAFMKTGDYGVRIAAYGKDGQILASTRNSDFKKYIISIIGQQFSEADKLLIDRKYEQAISEYIKQIEKNKNDAHSIRILAVLYQRGYANDGTGKDLEKALKYYKLLNEIKPSPFCRLALGDLYLSKGELTLAIESYTDMINRNDENKVDAYYGLIDAYTYSGQFSKILDCQNKINQIGLTGYRSTNVNLTETLKGDRSSLVTLLKDSYLKDADSNMRKFIADLPSNDFDRFYQLIKQDKREEAFAWIENAPESNYMLFYKAMLFATLADKNEVNAGLKKVVAELKLKPENELLASNIETIIRSIRGLEREK